MMAGGGGNDTFENWGLTYTKEQSTKILDFDDTGDKISLLRKKNLNNFVYTNTYTISEPECTGYGPLCSEYSVTIRRTPSGDTSLTHDDIVVRGEGVYELRLQDLLNSQNKGIPAGRFISR